MRLIEMVRTARHAKHNWIACDENRNCYSYKKKPEIKDNQFAAETLEDELHYLGDIKNLKNWEKSLIDVSKIQIP